MTIPLTDAIAVAHDLGLGLADAETLARLATNTDHAISLALALAPRPTEVPR